MCLRDQGQESRLQGRHFLVATDYTIASYDCSSGPSRPNIDCYDAIVFHYAHPITGIAIRRQPRRLLVPLMKE
jgi:hypothetical protein